MIKILLRDLKFYDQSQISTFQVTINSEENAYPHKIIFNLSHSILIILPLLLLLLLHPKMLLHLIENYLKMLKMAVLSCI